MLIIVLLDGREYRQTSLNAADESNDLNTFDMSKHYSHLFDLPDELFLMIFNKLQMVDVLYFIADVDERLNRIAHDFLYIRQLDLTGLSTIKSRFHHLVTDEQISSHLCEKILPRISDQVQRMVLESYAMKDIFAAVSYPQLYSLSFRNFQDELLHQCLTDDPILRHVLSKQITHLHIDISSTNEANCWQTVTNIFILVLSLCERLTELQFSQYIDEGRSISPECFLLQSTFISSNLTKLEMNVSNFYDCLILLDGRLESLSTLSVNVHQIFNASVNMFGKEELPKLKSFSLTSFVMTDCFDILIVPLIRRMINLERLKLFLNVYVEWYVDGTELSDQLLNHLTQLQKLTFCIESDISNGIYDEEISTNERIQRSFSGKHYGQVVSIVHYKTDKISDRCTIYSLPYDFEYFLNLDNSYRSGSFEKVRLLTMNDDRPFEDELFRTISHDMPYLERLSISNEYPQKSKQRSSMVLIFPHLTYLCLKYAHDDYTELFLLKKNTSLPHLSNLVVQNASLRRLKRRFNGDEDYLNINGVIFDEPNRMLLLSKKGL